MLLIKLRHILFIFALLQIPVAINAIKPEDDLISSGDVYGSMSAALANPEKVVALDLSSDLNPWGYSKAKLIGAKWGTRARIQSLDAQIGKLVNLRSLSLWGNDIKTLPESISELKNLRAIALGDNPLDLADTARKLGKIKSLRYISLFTGRDNKIKKFPRVSRHI